MAIGSVTSSTFGNLSQVNAASTRQKMAAQMLKDMDTDQSGSVSKAEFTAFGEKMKAQAPKGTSDNAVAAPAMPSADELFGTADTNSDNSLSVDELSSMMAQAEAQHAAAGNSAVDGSEQRPMGPPPGGAGGPPPGGAGGPSGASSSTQSTSSQSSSSSSSTTTDAADTNHDGTVSVTEKLMYSLTHPTATKESSST